MDFAFAEQFTNEWLDAWNSHDLERILSHFTDDVVFTSPVAIRVLEGSDGVIRGKAALRHYWGIGLERIPDLHFELESIYLGVRTVVINYRNQAGALVNEVLTFDGPLVATGHATYETGPTA
ncbi:MAG TPA: nuclear transport factor 2 family protein [Acidimicrobiales bacterium]